MSSWVLDLDGVVWRGNEPIEGSANAIQKLQTAGQRVTYVTNNSSFSATDLVNKMKTMGISANEDDMVSTRELLIELIGTNKKVLCATGAGLAHAIRDAGNTVWSADELAPTSDPATMLPPPEVDHVIVSQRFDLTLLQLSIAAQALLQCRSFLAPNRDPLYPTEFGMTLGTGSLIAALEKATGLQATVVGKPEQAMVDFVMKKVPDAKIVVGDQLESDGELARKADIPFAYVKSGVGEARKATNSNRTPIAYEATNLAALVDQLL